MKERDASCGWFVPRRPNRERQHRAFAPFWRQIASPLLLMVAAATLTGCGAVTESLLVDPAAYAYYRCDDIARILPSKLAREQQLKALIATAEQDAFGSVIAAVAYKDEYVRTRAEIRQLAESAKDRRCEGISTPPEK